MTSLDGAEHLLMEGGILCITIKIQVPNCDITFSEAKQAQLHFPSKQLDLEHPSKAGVAYFYKNINVVLNPKPKM